MLSIEKIDRQQWMKFFTHLIVICMLFFLPDLMINYASPHRNAAWMKVMYIKSAIFVAFFYINYYVIIQRTLFGRRSSNYAAFVLWNLLLIVVFLAGLTFINDYFFPHSHKRGGKVQPQHIVLLRNWSFILRDVAMAVLTIALSVALRFAERLAVIRKRHDELLAAQRQEELEGLKSQLNPHFLFNTLNTIYSLVEISPGEAQNAIHLLSKLLRYVLYENALQEKLYREVDFARTYISLMEMRLGPDSVKASFSDINPDTEIAPLIFVTLIENAFKHGNTGQKGQPIEISITEKTDGTIICRTFNHFIPHSPDTQNEDVPKKKHRGIGLTNLRRRLLLIYGQRASLTTEIKADTYTAILTIKPSTSPCHLSDAAS